MNIFDEVESLCDQWERTAGPLPPDARYLITMLARRIVMEAGRICEARGSIEAKSLGIQQEAKKCGAQLRHGLLCHQGAEQCCIYCDGACCERCGQTGLYKLTPYRLDPELDKQIQDSLDELLPGETDDDRNSPL